MSSPNLSKRSLPLDGIRGIAIALVIIHHGFFGAKPSGALSTFVARLAASCWVGVDLFFVLSGFLITGILLKSRDSAGYFRIFYMRRFFRIFPLYYSLLAAALLVSAAFYTDVIPKLDLSWNLLYLANIRLALHGWAWRPVSHLWSLSVEEQFYLVWPTVIFLLPRRHTLSAISAIFVAFLALRQVFAFLIVGHREFVFGVLHLDGLLLGAALAALYASRPAAANARQIAWAALVLTLAALAMAYRPDRILNWRAWQGLQFLNYALVAAAGAALVAVSIYSHAGATVNRVLSIRPLVELGKYSYAVYVVHYPLDTAFHELNLHPTTTTGTILYTFLLGCASFIVALGTWKLIEERCIKLKDRWFSYDAPRIPASQPATVGAAATPAL